MRELARNSAQRTVTEPTWSSPFNTLLIPISQRIQAELLKLLSCEKKSITKESGHADAGSALTQLMEKKRVNRLGMRQENEY